MSVERQLLMAASGVSTQYTIAKSLRFRSSASAYLSRTYLTAGSTTTWTYSTWIKRGALGALQDVLRSYYTSINHCGIYFQTNDTLNMVLFSGAVGINLITAQVFRDPSAWYHIVVAVDTTQATASNRVKIYVNGVQITSFSTATYPAQNSDTYMCSSTGWTHVIGKFYDFGTTSYLDGYLAEINFIDGQALTPSSFGETSSTTGVWIPKQYSGTYGTNGFYLKFTDTTSTTALGNDSSGNGNNWTPNNLSLTTGSTYDSMLDSPTNYDNGGNGVGNYAVLNPLSVRYSGYISDGNLNVVTSGGNVYNPASSSIAVSSGKWYFEALAGGNAITLGIALSTVPMSSGSPGSLVNVTGTYAYLGNGWSSANGTYNSSYGASYASGDVIGVALDLTAGTLTFYKNGVSQGIASTGLSGSFVMFVEPYSTQNWAANFGQRPFAYTPPTGYKALNTQNLSTPSIINGASYMAATTYTGTGASLSVSGAAFQPDLVWIKSRSAATDHALYDVIRGVQDRLESNTTDAEVTSDNGLTAFNSNGFTVNTLAQVNTNAATYIGWQWKAGGTAVTNTAGSITSSVSANTTSGFSVVTYTGTGANATVGHGLGVAPSMVIVKARANATGWVVGHAYLNGGSSPWNYYLSLESTAAQGSTNLTWNNTAPTSTVFSLGSGSGTNPSSTMVAYCFAAIPGYSAFGSYTGNGSTDGPFVFTGMRPRWIMVKRTDSASAVGWFIWDTSRASSSGGNVTGYQLYPNSSTSESSQSSDLDILSNGFKMRGTYQDYNASGGTYVYAAFAENPFQNARAR